MHCDYVLYFYWYASYLFMLPIGLSDANKMYIFSNIKCISKVENKCQISVQHADKTMECK